MNLPRDTQRERLFYIEYLAIFVGRVSRKDLVARFGISEPAATKDLSLYSELAPNVLRYDLRQKCYVLDEEKPYFDHDVEQALFSLAGERAITVDTERAKRLPSWVSCSIRRQVPLNIASAITRSIYQGLTVEAEYSSASSGESARLLSPLALVNDGLRWHARCFDHEKNDFRDFILTRFSIVRPAGHSSASLEQDVHWKNEVQLELIPHPKADHPEAIRIDFDIADHAKYVSLKPCIVGYFLRHWHIDYSDDAEGNPKAQQLYLNNKKQLIADGVPAWAFV